MGRRRRVADVATFTEVAGGVAERPAEHEELLAAAVHVRPELPAGVVAHDRRGACDLRADAVQHATVDALHWGRHPLRLRSVHHAATVEISVQLETTAHTAQRTQQQWHHSTSVVLAQQSSQLLLLGEVRSRGAAETQKVLSLSLLPDGQRPTGCLLSVEVSRRYVEEESLAAPKRRE